MKTNKIFYWSATGLVAAGMLMSGTMYLLGNPEIRSGFTLLGYPMYFVVMLGLAKIAGALALLVPGAGKLKEWAYAGFAFCFIGAIWSHVATSTPFIAPLVFLIILAISYYFRSRLQDVQRPVSYASA